MIQLVTRMGINMKPANRFRALLTLGVILGIGAATFRALADPPPANGGPQVKVRILRQDEYEGKLDDEKTTATMVEVTLDPLAGSPPHRHPGPLSGYVIEGTFEFQVEGGPVRTLKAGESFFEPKMILHKLGRNPDKQNRTRVLATIVHPSDAESIVIVEPSDAKEEQ